jgi:DNA-binding transcriptional MerR regulator
MPLTFGLNKDKIDTMESLDSLVLGLSEKYRYNSVRWLAGLIAPPPIEWGEFDLLYRSEQFQSLAKLAKVDVDTLYNHTLHRFLPSYYAPKELASMVGVEDYGELPRPLWPHQGVLKYTRYKRTLCGQAICPHCWAEGKTILLPWSLLHVTTCPRHEVLLVDRCTECGKAWRKGREKGQCRQCGARVEDLRTLRIGEHPPSKVLQSLIYGKLGYAIDRDALNAVHAQPANPVNELSPHDLMRFLFRFGQILMLRDPENPIFSEQVMLPGNAPKTPYVPQDPWDLSGILGVSDIHNVLTGACRLLVDWPNAWYTTLDRLVVREERSVKPRLPQILQQEFAGPEWAWLNNGWEEFVGQNAKSSIALQPWLHYYRNRKRARGEVSDVLSPRQAARYLGVRIERFKSMIEQGAIEATPRNGGSRSKGVILVTMETVRQLEVLRRSELTVTQVAKRLAIGEAPVRELIATGILTRDGMFNRTKPRVLENTLADFLAKVLEKAEVLPPELEEGSILTLEQASLLGTYYGPNKAKLIVAVYHGLIRTFKADGEEGLRALRFLESDVQSYAVNEPQPDGRLLVARSEVLSILKCTYRALDRYCKLGLLLPIESSVLGPNAVWRYDSRDIEAFQQRYVKSGEAASLLGCAASTLLGLARANSIPTECIRYIPEGGRAGGGRNYLFVRDALLEWGQDRISTKDAARLFGVSPGTVRAWVIEGRLIRIGPLWLSRKQVMERLEDRITTKEVMRLLGVSHQTIWNWVRTGIIVPIERGSKNGKWWYFSRSELIQWQKDGQEKFLTSSEAAELLEVSQDTFFKWVRLGNITPAGRRIEKRNSWYFSRQELTEWRAERMTVKEAIAALGINRHKWDYWRETGKVAPMDDGFVGKTWFSREDMLALRYKMDAEV